MVTVCEQTCLNTRNGKPSYISMDVAPNRGASPGLLDSVVPYHFLFYSFPITLLTVTDRLYLASYINPPTADTLFPYPDPPLRSPTKRSQRAVDGPTSVQRPAHKQPFYFTVDDTLLYNAFHHDFGPLHIGHLYRFALQFHDILGAPENKDRPVVFWSRADPRSITT